MTRKRFIKLVMSAGYQRNAANALADAALKTYGNYQRAWDTGVVFKVKKSSDSLNRLYVL